MSETRNLALVDTIEDVENLDYNQIIEEYTQMVEDYKKYISSMTKEELQEEEKRIVPIMEEYDKQVKEKVYELADRVEFQGRTYTRSQIGYKIVKILSRYECEYKFTLGLFQMAKWWESPLTVIDYSTLDSTLRVLGNPSIKYKGPKEWESILAINAYFESCNDEYKRDMLKTYMFAERHSALLDALQLNTPISGSDGEEQGDIMLEE